MEKRGVKQDSHNGKKNGKSKPNKNKRVKSRVTHDNADNEVKTQVIQDNDSKESKIEIELNENQINNTNYYVQFSNDDEVSNSKRINDDKDADENKDNNDSNDDGYNNNTKDVEYYEEYEER